MTTQEYRRLLIRELWWHGYTLKQAALIASKIVRTAQALAYFDATKGGAE